MGSGLGKRQPRRRARGEQERRCRANHTAASPPVFRKSITHSSRARGLAPAPRGKAETLDRTPSTLAQGRGCAQQQAPPQGIEAGRRRKEEDASTPAGPAPRDCHSTVALQHFGDSGLVTRTAAFGHGLAALRDCQGRGMDVSQQRWRRSGGPGTSLQPARWSYAAVVVLEQPRSDQTLERPRAPQGCGERRGLALGAGG